MLLTAGDVRTACFEFGAGEPVVLIHGIGEDHRSWRKLVPLLCMRHKVIAYDVRGFGQSSLGDAKGTLAQLGDDVIGLLDALALPSAHVIGFSMGGTIAMRAAIDHPERIKKLVIVATTSRVNDAAMDRYLELAHLALNERDRFAERLDTDVRRVYGDYPDEIVANLELRRQATADPRGYANAALAMASLRRAPLDDELARVRSESLIVAGALDPNCSPRAAEVMRSRIPRAALEILDDAPHPIPTLRAEALAALLQRFLG
jgi:pimeloyl-ACP methyl ester carboxylesterase